MKIDFLSKNFTVTDKLKEIFTKKLERLDKFFEDGTKIKVMMKKSRDAEILELTIIVDSTVLRAEVSGDKMFENIDIALPKLEKQIIRNREKLSAKSKKFRLKDIDSAAHAKTANEPQSKLVRSKTYDLIPMSVEDAMAELDLVGHSFYVFANSLTNAVNVIYKRNDGDYGLIETTLAK